MVSLAVEEHLKMSLVVSLMVRLWMIDLSALPFQKVPLVVCFKLVPLDCDGFMTDLRVLGDEVM